jgi:hypothetical protein
MNWYSIFYWLTVAGNVKAVAVTFAVIFGIYSIFATIAAFGAFDDNWEKWEKTSKKVYLIFVTTFILSLFMSVFLPSKKDSLIIVAGGAVGEFITTDSTAKQLPSDLVYFVHSYLVEKGASFKNEFKAPAVVKEEPYIEKLKQLSKEELLKLIEIDSLTVKK